MRILQVIPTYAPAWRYGGPIRAVADFAGALLRRGHDVHVFTTDLDGPDRLDVPKGVPVDVDGVTVRYFAAGFPARLSVARGMRDALRAELPKFDVAHLHSVFLWPTQAAARCARAAGVPYVLSPRGMLVKELIRRKNPLVKGAWLKLVERGTIEGASTIHVTSKIEEDELRAFGFQLPEVYRMPNGVEWPEGEVEARAPSRDVLFLGRLHEKKRPEVLLRAVAGIEGVTLTFAGPDDGELPALRRLAVDLGVESRVEFRKAVYGAEKSALVRAHRTLALPSRQENFGNVVLEAMAHGVPVVVTEQVGAAEIVREHHAGRVCGAATGDLRTALSELLRDEPRRRETGRRAQEAAGRFTWDVIAARFEDRYAELAQCRAGVGANGAPA